MKASIGMVSAVVLVALTLVAFSFSLVYADGIASAALGLLSAFLVRILVHKITDKYFGEVRSRRPRGLTWAKYAGFAFFVGLIAWLVIAPTFLHLRHYDGMLAFLGVGILLLLAGVALVFGFDAADIWARWKSSDGRR